MKKLTAMLLAAILICLPALAETTGAQYLGRWVCDRAAIEISDEHPGYRVFVTWGSSASETSEWTYYCPYELEDGALVSEPTGTRNDVTSSDACVESDTVYEDGTGVFAINDDGKLIWIDSVENIGNGMEFERAPMIGFAPTAEEFAISYFGMIGDGELPLDAKACEAMNFAAASELWLADTEALRANMLTAWDGLSEDAQNAFNESFMDVVYLLDGCFEDWAANRAAFTDDRDARMEELLSEPLYREAWQTLCGNTLTLGNSDD